MVPLEVLGVYPAKPYFLSRRSVLANGSVCLPHSASDKFKVVAFIAGGLVTGTLSGREAKAFYLPIGEVGSMILYKFSHKLNLTATLALGYIPSKEIPYFYSSLSMGVGISL